ncbi:MAG: RagB/SusD family nutrient uptake outer membrane protein, partial [Chitinophagaceae bacterium]
MRTKIILAATVLSLAVTSCKKDFVDQADPNAGAINGGLKTETDVLNAVNGVYQSLRSGNCVGEGAALWTDDRADDVNTTDNQSNNGEPFQFSAFSIVPSNSYLQSHWTALYLPISRANLVLSLIDGVTFANEANRTIYKAELKFIRAYMYYNLVKEFGDVPVVTERITTKEQAAALTVRQPRQVVYDQIVTDLLDVLASNLPVRHPENGKGRVSMQAANGLLGLVYLTMGTSLDGANAQANFTLAETYLLACYNQRTFGKLSDIPFSDVFDVT